MAGPVQTVHYPLGAGIDEAVREEMQQPGQSLLVAQNVRYAKRGGLAKRNGYTSLGTARLDGTNRAHGYKVIPFDKQILTIDGLNLDTWIPELSVCAVRSQVTPCGPPRRRELPYSGLATIASSTRQVFGIDCAIIGDLQIVMISSLVGATFDYELKIFDTDGAVVSSTVLPGAGTFPGKLAVVGSTAYAVFISANNLQIATIDCSSAAGINAGWSVSTLIGNAANGGIMSVQWIDVAYTNLGFYIAYITILGLVHVVYVVGGAISTTFSAGSAFVPALAIGSALFVSYNVSGTGYYVVGLDPITLAVVDTPDFVAIPGGGSGSPDKRATALIASTNDVQLFVNYGGLQSATFNAAAGAMHFRRLTLLATPFVSKPWIYPAAGVNRTYIGVVSPSVVSQQFYAVIDVTPNSDGTTPAPLSRPAATISPLLSFMQALTNMLPFAVPGNGSAFSLMNVTQHTSLSGSIELVSLDFADTDRWLYTEFNGVMYLTGGVVSYFDSFLVREANFILPPDQPTLNLSGGGAITETNITYVALYEAYDASGNIAWSATSKPSAQISPAAQHVLVTVSLPSVTMRPADSTLVVSIYRTASATGNLIYYRVGVILPWATFSIYSATFTDNMSAGVTIAQPQMYKQPGLPGTPQDRYAPPGSSAIVSYNGGLVTVGDDGFSVWGAAQQVISEEIWWSPIFQFPITEEGPITALAVMDGTLFIFKRAAIYSVTGTPPSDNGAQGGFNAPGLISANSGCREPRSIVVTNQGMFYLSDRGIELLVRGGQSTQWIGEQVRDTVGTHPVCVAATLDWTAERVYFEMNASEVNNQVTGDSVCLVYNLTVQSWESVDIRTNSSGGQLRVQSACMAWLNGAWTYVVLQPNGELFFSNLSSWVDAGYLVARTIEVPWVKQGLQQQQLVNGGLLLLDCDGSTGLQMEFANRFGQYDPSMTKKWNESDLTARELEMRPLQQNWAFKMRLTEQAPAGYIGGSLGGSQNGGTYIGLSFDIAQPDPGKGLPNLADTVRR